MRDDNTTYVTDGQTAHTYHGDLRIIAGNRVWYLRASDLRNCIEYAWAVCIEADPPTTTIRSGGAGEGTQIERTLEGGIDV